MALLRTMLVFMLCLTFFLSLAGMQTMFSAMMSGDKSFIDSIYDNLVPIVAGAGIITIALGTFSFPNPYVIFAGLAWAFLQFFTFPVQLFTDMSLPVEIRVFLIGLFQLFYLLAVIEFFKGGES